METPDSDLFTKEAKEPYKNISLAPPPGPPPLEIQVVLAIPELANNQVLVHLTPESSRVRIEPTPRFIVLESWTLSFAPRRGDEDHSIDVALPTIYKHGIPLFRSLFTLLRVLPTWKLYKRLKRRTGGPQHLSIQLRVRSSHDPDHLILDFDTPVSPTIPTPLSTQTHTFSAVPHPLGSLTLSARFLETPNFQLEELESVLSSRFISQDLGGGEGFVPTLTKNHQRDSSISSSGMRSVLSKSPPKSIGRTVSSDESASIAERFILPARTPSNPPSSGAGTGTAPTPVRNIPQPPRQLASGDFAGVPNQSPSGLAISRLRKESLGSSPSSSLSGRDLPMGIPFATTNPSLSSLSSSPSSGGLPIRRPSINPVHPFKSNTVSSASGSSPSLSIRQAGITSGSPLSTGITGSHSRSSSISGVTSRPPPSPIGIGLPGGADSRPSPPLSHFSPSSLDVVKRPGTSGSAGSAGSGERDRRVSLGVGASPDDGRVAVPPRKRYSSSFGHRFTNSVGSTGGGSAEGGSGGASAAGGGTASGRSTPAIPPSGSGLGIDLGTRERKESSAASFMSTATDDDDISLFVQDIDSRKPLSGRWKEREKRDWERQQSALRDGLEGVEDQSHGRDTSEASTVKPLRSERTITGRLSTSPPSTAPSSRFSTLSDAAPIPSTLPSAIARERDPAVTSTSPPALSLSPTRGPMLTSQGEVSERLKRMNETFLKSLEGFDPGNAAKRKEREQRKREKERERERERERVQSTTSPRKPNGDDTRPSGSSANRDDAQLAGYASRGLSIRSPRERTPLDEDGGWKSPGAGGSERNRGFASRGMGLRGPMLGDDDDSTSSLGHSEVNVSQGSEEVIGKMELYEERSRRKYHRY
ncbi:hypothetical protein CC1G_07785 [Coprinopsis cinerea okayama7|uniref:Autophagy-related protein 13 n=1 Tax=Coprinopsis cinerea (strain Okayama-7 / 130 / ATCC MYA-4618 / FGSC 9003) TaxID=240176 RepID=A8NP13_COPC7|nr:hypothetical protein CC1G_07785 [Coprinopsis cinerea okayama7\|eukprot:XP_001835242.2 hypothetical protein CC1G_07785 [Coprinopsis cinerea okayama7\